jgi:hypothetical protein
MSSSPSASSTSSSNLSFSSVDSQKIFCFVCGLSINKSSFNFHYNDCKNHYEKSKINEIKPLEEPNNLDDFLLNLENEKIENEDISDFNDESKEIYLNRRIKKCDICDKNMSLEEFLIHDQELHNHFLLCKNETKKINKPVTHKSSKKILKFLKDLTNEEICSSGNLTIVKC